MRLLREYSNKKIYKNFKIAHILSIIARVIAILTLILEIFYYCIGLHADDLIFLFFDEYPFYALLYAYSLICIPFNYRFIKLKKTHGNGFVKMDSKNNDLSNLRRIIIGSFLPLYLVLFFFLCHLCSTIFNILDGWFVVPIVICARLCGRMFLSHFWVYIADIFLIRNCGLIKCEWKNDPPDFVKELQESMERKQYNTLIKKCGVRFFIKYYRQIKRLSLRDVVVSENYTPAERTERIFAAKKLIDLNLTEFALIEILKEYSDVLSKNEIEQAKSILTEIGINRKCL